MATSKSLLSLAFCGVSTAWVAALVAAPHLGAGAAGPLGTRIAAATYLAGGALCHQRAARSFHLWGAQLPVCARCTGLYVPAPIASLVAICAGRRGRRRERPWRPLLAAAAVPTAATVLVEWLGLTGPTNMVRAVAAIPLGFAVSWLLTDAIQGNLR